MASPIEIFCCYAHEDEVLLNMLKTHLMSLQRRGIITTWADTDISPGVDWEIEINKHINSAQIILLLISPDFMASDYCYSKEMSQALERHKQGSARVIPIILRPVSFQGAPFAKLHALPKHAIPLKKWPDIDDGFLSIVEGIQLAIKNLPQSTASQPPVQLTSRTYRVPLLNTSSLLATNKPITPLISAGPQNIPLNAPSYSTNNWLLTQPLPIPQPGVIKTFSSHPLTFKIFKITLYFIGAFFTEFGFLGSALTAVEKNQNLSTGVGGVAFFIGIIGLLISTIIFFRKHYYRYHIHCAQYMWLLVITSTTMIALFVLGVSVLPGRSSDPLKSAILAGILFLYGISLVTITYLKSSL